MKVHFSLLSVNFTPISRDLDWLYMVTACVYLRIAIEIRRNKKIGHISLSRTYKSQLPDFADVIGSTAG